MSTFERPANQAVGQGSTNKPKTTKPKTKKPSYRAIIDEATNGLNATDPTAPMTMAQLNTGMQSAIQGKYGQSRSDLGGAINQSEGRQQAIPAYYQEYLNTLKNLQGASSGAYNAAAASANTGTQTGSLGALNNLFAGSMASRGQNAYDASQAQISQLPQMQLGAQQAETAQKTGLQKQLGALDTAAGDYGNEWLIKAIQAERTNQVDNLTLQAATGKASTAQDTADAKFQAQYGISMADAADGIDAAEAKTMAAFVKTLHPKTPKTPATHAPIDGIDWDVHQKMTPAQRLQAHKDYVASGRAPAAASGNDKYGNTPEQQRSNQNAWEGGLTTARDFGPAAADLVPYLTSQHVPADLVKIIDTWAKKQPGQKTGGKITQKQIDALHKIGIKVGSGHLLGANPVNPRLP